MRAAVLGHTYIVDANRGKLRQLARRGHDVLLLTPREWLEKDFGLRRFERAPDLDAATFDCPDHGRVRRYRFPCGDLLRAVRGWRPDAILAETEPGGLAALQAAWLAERLGAPLLPFAWENLPLTGSARALARPVYCAARRLLAGSAGAATVARRAGCARPITVIPQVGVDPAAVAERPKPAGLPTALFIARLDRKKGADLLLDALALAPNWRAIIVGDGAERAALAAQAKRLGLIKRVEFVGAVTHTETPQFFARADAFVLPSRSVPGWTEQFGHVLAWAMAAGTPIIGSACGAIPEVAGDAGLIVPENDAPALAEALRQLADGEFAETLGNRGRRRAAALFTDEAVARRLERALVMALERDDADVLV